MCAVCMRAEEERIAGSRGGNAFREIRCQESMQPGMPRRDENSVRCASSLHNGTERGKDGDRVARACDAAAGNAISHAQQPSHRRRRAHPYPPLQCTPRPRGYSCLPIPDANAREPRHHPNKHRLHTRQRPQRHVHRERHLYERRRAREVLAADDKRERRHGEGGEPGEDEERGAARGGDGGEDVVRGDGGRAEGEDEDGEVVEDGYAAGGQVHPEAEVDDAGDEDEGG
ncbi:hypothetical protein DFH06DRAFT_1168017 [Mycena polygramma]|nr:hypothetical protein DFH06DRAFT_1168017 [Mycena polygramma]